MKKLFLIILITAAFSNTANAKSRTDSGSEKDHPYVGLDFTFSGVEHRHAADNDGVGLGLSLGYKSFVTDKVFLAPEVFYDYLDTPVVYRLGAKVNLGYKFDQKFSGFVNVGVTNNSYDDSRPGSQASYDASANRVAVLYGAGVSYDLNRDWALRGSYDWQRFDAKYNTGQKDRLSLGVLKLGTTYSF
jgi:opacity protein-like surface antigen